MWLKQDRDLFLSHPIKKKKEKKKKGVHNKAAEHGSCRLPGSIHDSIPPWLQVYKVASSWLL
jgi:hypothetical protein